MYYHWYFLNHKNLSCCLNLRGSVKLSANVVVAWRSSEKKVRDLKFILNIGNFFWGAKFLQTTCWTQSAVVEIWSSDHHVGTQYGKGARAQRSCSVATFQKRIASQRSHACSSGLWFKTELNKHKPNCCRQRFFRRKNQAQAIATNVCWQKPLFYLLF